MYPASYCTLEIFPWYKISSIHISRYHEAKYLVYNRGFQANWLAGVEDKKGKMPASLNSNPSKVDAKLHLDHLSRENDGQEILEDIQKALSFTPP